MSEAWKAFADQLAREHSPPTFKPFASYNPDGDSIEFYARPDSFYAERIDDLVTVFYSHETRELVGSMIKGIKKLKDNPQFYVSIEDGKVRLDHLLVFVAALNQTPDPGNVTGIIYKKLVTIAEEVRVRADLCPAGG